MSGRPSRRYRSYPNKCWLLRQADTIVTVTTTKTIIREHETDLVIQEARAVADDVVALTFRPTWRRAPGMDAGRPHRPHSRR